MQTSAWLLPAVLLFGAGCARRGGDDDDEVASAAIPQRLQADGTVALSPQELAAADVQIAPAAEGELADAATRYGRVRPMLGEETLISSPVTGRIPRPPAAQLGAHVQAGALLLEVIPVLAAAERISVGVRGAELEGEIEAARRELSAQQAGLERSRELARSSIVSEAKLLEAETQAATTRARFDALQRARTAQTAGEGTAISLRAPSAGTVVSLNGSSGALVQQGDLLVRLLQPGPRWVDVAVTPSEPVGERYEVAVGAAWVPATLVATGKVVEDDGTRKDRLKIEEAAAVDLIPGQTVPVRVARGQSRGIVLPEAALVPGLKGDLVFVETAPGRFAPTPVKVAARLGGQARLASGLQAGAKVVVRGAMALQGERRRSELKHVE